MNAHHFGAAVAALLACVSTLCLPGASSAQTDVGSSDSGPAFSGPMPVQPAGIGNDFGYAIVNGDGTLSRGLIVVATRHLGTGAYEVYFKARVASCAYTGSLAEPGVSTIAPGSIGVALRSSGSQKGLFVKTFDSTGEPADRAFSLILLC